MGPPPLPLGVPEGPPRVPQVALEQQVQEELEQARQQPVALPVQLEEPEVQQARRAQPDLLEHRTRLLVAPVSLQARQQVGQQPVLACHTKLVMAWGWPWVQLWQESLLVLTRRR